MTASDWAGLAAIVAIVGFCNWVWIWYINVKYDNDRRKR